MADPVKTPRGYERSGRQARSRLTRTAVIDAARTLFFEHGFASTSIEAISDLAGTSPATVYRLFSTKLGILKALMDVSVVGDDKAIALWDRSRTRALLVDQDPRHRLAQFAALVRDVQSRITPLYRVLVGAAASDPDAAELLAEYNRQRQEGQGHIAHALARDRALRQSIRERDAADIIHALGSPEVYHLLTADRGWTPERYERWLAGTLADQLVRPDDGRATHLDNEGRPQ